MNKRARSAKHTIGMLIILMMIIALLPYLRAESSELEEVTLQLKWLHQFQFAGYYAAKEKGFYLEEGLDVVIQQRDPKDNNIRQVLDGEAEYGIADSILLLYRMRGEPVVLLAPIFQQSPLVYMTLRSSGLESPYQLKGKRVMVYPRGTDGLPLEAMFHELGIEERDFSPIPKTVNPDALEKGLVDVYPGYLANEPYYFHKKNIKINIIDPKNYGVDFYGDMLFTSQTELENHPERAERFLHASLKGWEYALDNTEEIIDVIIRKYGVEKSREHLQYEADIIRRMIKPKDIALGKLDHGRLRYIARTFKRLGITESQEVPKGFLRPRTLEPSIELTDEEIQWVKAHRIIRVANETDWPPFDFAENGVATGYSIDLLNLVAGKVGLQIEYVNGYTWDTLLDMGKRQELDLFPAIWKTEEREQFLNFSAPYIDTPHILVVHEDQNHIDTINDLNGRVLVGIKGFASTELVKKHYPEIRVVEVSNAAEGLRLVSYNRADAYLGSYGETDFEIREHLITHLKIAGETALGGRVQASQLHIAVRKDWPELSRIIRKALNSITAEEKRALQTTWLRSEATQPTLALSEEERIWLKNHPVLHVAFDVDWPPVEFVAENGDMDGIAADYLKRMSDLLRVRLEPASPRSWKEMLTSVRNRELDFFSAVSPTVQRSEWLDFTDSYLSFPIVIVTREDVPYIGKMEDLANNMVAVVNGYASHDLLSGNHPDLPLLLTKDVKEGLMAVRSGKTFAFIGSLATVSHIIGREGLTGLKVSGQTPYTFNITMGVPKGETILLNLLRKALAAIPPHERSAIYSKWIHVDFEPAVDYSLVWRISVGALVIVSVILYWNRRLSSMARELKTAKDTSEEARVEADEARIVAEAAQKASLEAQHAAEAANLAKSVFLANMSHELRTPLTGILGYTQILGQGSNLTDTQREGTDIIYRNGEHLLTLINDILDFAKIDTNRLELHPAEFALPDFLKQLAEMTRLNAEQKGLSFVYQAPAELPQIVSGDPKRLRQILMNLLGNAVRFTEQGKVILRIANCELRNEPTPAPSQEGKSEIRNFKFEIEDTGIGIAPEHLERIFQPFQQADPYKLQEGSTGLGLAISQRLVEMMGSQLHITSTVGEGSTFWFDVELPVIDATISDVTQPLQGTVLEHPSREILTTTLTALPAEWLAMLKQAAEETDIEALCEILELIRERDAAVADTLAQLVEDFEYDEILALIQGTE